MKVQERESATQANGGQSAAALSSKFLVQELAEKKQVSKKEKSQKIFSQVMELSTAAKDPQKAKQIDRLGLGLCAIGGSGGKSGVSHSITSGIRTIQQDDLTAATKTTGFGSSGRKAGRDFFGGTGISDDWEIVDEEERASRNKFGIDDLSR